MLQLYDVSARYDALPVVNDVTLTFPAGKLCGLIGPNGAGKSTLLKVCAGIIRDYEGTIRFRGKDISEDRYWLKTQLGYAPEDVELLPYLNGQEFLYMIAGIRRVEHAADEIKFLLNMFGLINEAEQLIINYSHGMRQKLSLAAALLGRPALLLLDEALNGLDTMALFRLREYLQELADEGRVVIIASHILPLIKEWCDPLIIMHKGVVLREMPQKEIAHMESEQKLRFDEFFIKLVNR